MKKWAIQSKYYNEDDSKFEYYSGHSYIYEGGKYLSTFRNVNKAKLYSSEKRAISAMNKIKFSFSNSAKMRVVEVEIDEK